MDKRIVIDLLDVKEGTWFAFCYSKLNTDTMELSYGEPIENGPRAKVRSPAPFFEEHAKNHKTESTMVLNKKARAMEKVISDKELTPAQKQAESDDMVDYLIQEVDAFKIKGRVMESTRKDKIEAMRLPLFSMFINRCVVLLNEQSVVEEKETSKNSSTGSSFPMTKPDPA